VPGAGAGWRPAPRPGLADRAVGFKTLPEAIWLRNRVLAQLDTASETEDAEERRTALGFVFVGAGFAGIEAIGELEDFARAALATYPPGIANEMRWVMVEATDRILPELDRALATYAADRLRERGIQIRTDTRLVSIEDGIVRLSDGSSIAARSEEHTSELQSP